MPSLYITITIYVWHGYMADMEYEIPFVVDQ